MESRRPWDWGVTMLRAILVAMLPFVLLLSTLRLALTPAYVWASYRMPGFPDDSYGFTLAEREVYANRSLAYLLNDAGIDFLGDQTFADGSPLFNERELRHMQDVKRLAQAAMGLWMASLLLAVAAGLGLYWTQHRRELGRAVELGGRLTLGLMLALALALLFSFPFVFVGFHRIFFEGNSWLFYYSDTLIRLFPERFWQQVFVFLTASTIALALTLGAIGRWLKAIGSAEPIES